MKYLKLLLIAAASSALFACGGDPSSPTSGGAATASINLNGGAGVNQDQTIDGLGGYLTVYSAGDVKVSRSGYPDAVFTAYSSHQPNYGANKATVSTDTTIILDPEADPGAGVLYARTDDQNLYVGGGADLVVTGLEVAQGATLKLPANLTGYGAVLHFANDVVIGGTVTTITESTDLELDTNSLIIVRTAGKVTTAATTAGSSGGGIWLYSSGVMVNQGVIDSSGAGGGSAGPAFLYARGVIFNSGSITARGGEGDSSNPQGGRGGIIDIVSIYSRIFSSGALNASGGAGSGAPGGYGGNVRIAGATEVDLVYLAINLNGGNGTANGGRGGDLSIFQMPVAYFNDAAKGDVSSKAAPPVVTAAGTISNDVPIIAKGGAGAGSGGNRGGDGGYVSFGQIGGVRSTNVLRAALQPLSFTTTISNSGAIDISGGAGDAGGNAGRLSLTAMDDVTNSAAITGKGGDGTSLGGYGSHVIILAEKHAANSGAINANGGPATTNGGNGGYIELFSGLILPTTNSGALSVVKGSGGTTAINGVIKLDGIDVTPLSGSI